MSQVATVIFLLFSGINLLSAQPFFGGPGFDGFPRGPFGGDLGPRTFGIGGDFGPPTIRRLGGRFPEFGADFGGIGGGIRGGGPQLGGVDGQRFGFNGDNALGVGGPRFDVLRRGRIGFDDTTLGTGFGRRVGGGGLGTRFIPGERLGAGGFGAGNAIAPRRLGTTRTITRGNALDVPRSTVLGGLGTDSAGSFTDPITGRRVRVLSNNDASTVVSRRATGTAGGATRTGTITTRRVDPVVTATRTRLPTTLTQRGTLLRRPLRAGRRTPITRLGGTTVTRPGTLAGTAGTGLTFLNDIRGGRGAFPRSFLPFDNIEGRPMIPLNALDGAEALLDPGRSLLGTPDGLPLSDFERLSSLARDINRIASQQLRPIPGRIISSNMSPSNPLIHNLAMTSTLVNGQVPITSPLVNGQSPATNPLVNGQSPINNPSGNGQGPVANPLVNRQGQVASALMNRQVPVSNPIGNGQSPVASSLMNRQVPVSNPIGNGQSPVASSLMNRQVPVSNPIGNGQSPVASSLMNRQVPVASVPIFNNFVQQQSLQTISSPLLTSANVPLSNTSPRLIQVPRQQVKPTPVASNSPSPSVTSQASRSVVRRHTSTTQRPLYQQINWIKLHQYMSRVIQFQQSQQQKALQEHAQRQLKEQSAKDEELMQRIKLLTDHIQRLEKQQHENLEVIRQQEEIKLQQKQNHEKQQREWQIMLQNLIDTLQSPQHKKHINGSLMNIQASPIPAQVTTVQGGVPIYQHETTPTGRLSSLVAGDSHMQTSVVSTQVGTISNSANVDVSAVPPSSDGVPVSGFASDQSGQGGRGNVDTELVSILPGSDPLLDMQKGSLQRYLQVNEDQRRQLQGTGLAALLAPSLLGINSTKGANLDLQLPLNDTVVTPSTIHNITSSPLSTTISGDSVIVEGKSFIDWSLFNKVLREEGLLLSNETSETSNHNDIVDARRTLQDLVDGRTTFQQLNQTVVGPGNNAQQGALGSFGQSSVPQGMSMVPGAGRGMDQQMGGMTSFIGGGGPHRTGTSNIGARAVSGVPGINSNRLTFDSVDLSAFGGQTGFGLGNGLLLARSAAGGVNFGLDRQGARLPLDEAARRALSVTNRRSAQTGMITGRVAGVTRRAIPGTVNSGRTVAGIPRNRVTVIRADASPVARSAALRGAAATGVAGTTIRRTTSTQARRMPGTSNLVAARQRGFVLDSNTRQRQGTRGATATATNVRRVSTTSRRVPSSEARRQVSRATSASMTVGSVGSVGASANVPTNIDLSNVPALDLGMGSGSSSSTSSASSASSSSSSSSTSSRKSSTSAVKTETVVDNNTGASSGSQGQGQRTRTVVTETRTTITGPDASTGRDLTSLEKQLIGAADVDRPVFAIIPMNDRANSADLQNIMENIATSMNTMTSTISPILPSMTNLETSNTIVDTTKPSNPPDPLAL